MRVRGVVLVGRYYGEDINKGRELPEELLRATFDSIEANQITPPVSGAASTGELSQDLWRDLLAQQQAISSDADSPHA